MLSIANPFPPIDPTNLAGWRNVPRDVLGGKTPAIYGLGVLWLTTLLLHLLVVVGAVAAVIMRRDLPVLLIAAVPVAIVLAHSTSLFLTRYFYPAMPFCLVLASVAVAQLSESRAAKAAGPLVSEYCGDESGAVGQPVLIQAPLPTKARCV